jgi:hypothetical protein
MPFFEKNFKYEAPTTTESAAGGVTDQSPRSMFLGS